MDFAIEGDVELVFIGDGYQIYREYLYDMQSQVHGMGVFEVGSEASAQGNYHWLLLARVGGEIVGLMLYSLRGEEVTEFNLRALRFYYNKQQGRYLLLDWIACHVDQASGEEIWLPPDEQPETWLADIKVTTKSAVRAPMGRIIDVAKINGMHVGKGEFSVLIQDDICTWNEGVWKFAAHGRRLTVTRGKEAACTLTIQGLSALIFGSHRLDEFKIRGWGDPSEKIRTEMQHMFTQKKPFLHVYF